MTVADNYEMYVDRVSAIVKVNNAELWRLKGEPLLHKHGISGNLVNIDYDANGNQQVYMYHFLPQYAEMIRRLLRVTHYTQAL